MSKKMPSTVNLQATLDGNKLATLRVDVSFGIRAPIINGSVTMMGIWRADVYECLRGARPKFLGTFCTNSSKEESPADLLRQLADIYEAGELKVDA